MAQTIETSSSSLQHQELLPGLPDSLVTHFLLPRLPWYTRPRMLSVSKTWQKTLRTPALYASATRHMSKVSGLLIIHEIFDQNLESSSPHAFISVTTTSSKPTRSEDIIEKSSSTNFDSKLLKRVHRNRSENSLSGPQKNARSEATSILSQVLSSQDVADDLRSSLSISGHRSKFGNSLIDPQELKEETIFVRSETASAFSRPSTSNRFNDDMSSVFESGHRNWLDKISSGGPEKEPKHEASAVSSMVTTFMLSIGSSSQGADGERRNSWLKDFSSDSETPENEISHVISQTVLSKLPKPSTSQGVYEDIHYVSSLSIADPQTSQHGAPETTKMSRTPNIHTQRSAQEELPVKFQTKQTLESTSRDTQDGLQLRRFAISMYNPEGDTWHRLPPILGCPSGVPARCSFLCAEGQVFVMGGVPDSVADQESSNVYMLHLAQGSWQWETRTSMLSSRAHSKCTLLQGKIYVLGGTSSGEVYDIHQDRWDFLPDMINSQFYCNGVLAVDNEIIAFGYDVIDEESHIHGPDVNSARIYQTQSGCWRNVEFYHSRCCTSAAGSNLIYDTVNNMIVTYDTTSRVSVVYDGKLEVGEILTYRRDHKERDSHHDRQVCDITVCRVHDIVAVEREGSAPHMYVMASPWHNHRIRSLWRGTLDINHFKLMWERINCPFELGVIEVESLSEMSYLS